MNELSVSLNQSGIWESLGDTLINRMLFCRFMPSALCSSGMQHFYNLCDLYDTNHPLSCNVHVTQLFSRCFKPN